MLMRYMRMCICARVVGYFNTSKNENKQPIEMKQKIKYRERKRETKQQAIKTKELSRQHMKQQERKEGDINKLQGRV